MRIARRTVLLLIPILLTACGSEGQATTAEPSSTPSPAARVPADACTALSVATAKRIGLPEVQPQQSRPGNAACTWMSSADRSLTTGAFRVLNVEFKSNSGADTARLLYKYQQRKSLDPKAGTFKVREETADLGSTKGGYDEGYRAFYTYSPAGPMGRGEIGLRKGNVVIAIVLLGRDLPTQKSAARKTVPMTAIEFEQITDAVVDGVVAAAAEG